MSFDAVFRQHRDNRPTHFALIDGARRIDFRTLDRLIDGTAHRLAGLGIVRGRLVGVALRDHADHVVTLLALARMGAVTLPMDCRWSVQEKRSMAEQFAADHVLLEADDSAVNGAPGWDPLPDCVESDEPYCDPSVDDASPLLLSLSSGTTGMPKGPRVSHRQFEMRFMAYWINLGMNAQDIFVCATPIYFGGGRGFTLGMLFAGGTVSIASPRLKSAELVAHVRRVEATVLFLVPTQLRRTMQEIPPGLAFPGLRVLISSGSALHPDERAAIRERLTPNLFELYSSTEGGSISVLTPADAALRQDSVGRPAFRVQVQIVDDAHRPLPAGQTGRLRYRSPASATEYYRAEGGDAFRDGWFYPGDLGRMDADGFLVLTGRAKDMIIRGGVNIYPIDIETVIRTLPLVRDVCVAAAPQREMGEAVAAFIVVDHGVTAEQVTSHCRAHLAAYKVPSIIRFVAEIPRNAGGKPLKAELIASLAAEPAR
jgi:acyl-CoA synthetase (AMP-forming)/AMP-acid ligase II